MYFTDKFPKSDLKTMHPSLVRTSPGRKQPAIHKNITSNDFMFLSKVYTDMIFQKQEFDGTVIKPNPEEIQEALRLQREITEKSRQIQDFESKVMQKFKDQPNALNKAVNFKSFSDMRDEYSKELSQQIREHEAKKLQDRIKRQEILNKRLEDLNQIREEEYEQRQKELWRAQEYKKSLETQSVLKKNYEFSQSAIFPALKGRAKNLFHQESYQKLDIPEKKNNNNLAVSLSMMPEFLQPKYTKRNPLVIKTSPILGDYEA